MLWVFGWPHKATFFFFFYRALRKIFIWRPLLSRVTIFNLITAHTPYKRTVKQFWSLQITARVLFVYFFIKAYVVGTHLTSTCGCSSDEYPQHMLLLRKSENKNKKKTSHKRHMISPFLTTSFSSNYLSAWGSN